MTEGRKNRTGLIICIILVGILAISSLGVYISLQGQINALRNEKASLQSQVSGLHTENLNLQSQVSNLKASDLHLINFEYTITDVWLGTDYVTVKGSIFNSGVHSAGNVVLTVRVYDSGDTLLKTEQIAFGIIEGKSYKNFDTDIAAEGAYAISKTLTHN